MTQKRGPMAVVRTFIDSETGERGYALLAADTLRPIGQPFDSLSAAVAWAVEEGWNVKA